jgi:peroxiredoxin
MIDLQKVDWSALPEPDDDGAAAHLVGRCLPAVRLTGTDGHAADLSCLPGLSVLYVYPMTGRPDRPLPDGWDLIPGARGCTPQSCSFRDHAAELRALGVATLFGVSTQPTVDQTEAAARLHLPFPLLSDEKLTLARALRLPTFDVAGVTLLKRLVMIVREGHIVKVFYPVFPPDRSAADVVAWLKGEEPRA